MGVGRAHCTWREQLQGEKIRARENAEQTGSTLRNNFLKATGAKNLQQEAHRHETNSGNLRKSRPQSDIYHSLRKRFRRQRQGAVRKKNEQGDGTNEHEPITPSGGSERKDTVRRNERRSPDRSIQSSAKKAK